jgi:4-amino-4-deoxy-L-arabinose transferase-like glycosyltransferase
VRRRSKSVETWLWLLVPILVSSALRDLWAPDEPRYAEVAREIYERGDFLVMHLCGEVYPDKPPLLFWMIGFLGWLSDWSVPLMRLVSIAATAGSAWLVALLARRWWGSREAALAPAIFLSTAMLTEIGGRLQLDPLLALWCTGALFLAGAPAASPAAAARNVLLAGLCAGMAALTKGPVAYVNVGLVLLAWRLLAPRAAAAQRASWWARGGAVCLAVGPVLAWALAAAMREPVLWGELFYGQHLERTVSSDRHGGALWKNVVRMPPLLLPWTLPVLLGWAAGLRSWRRKSPFDTGLVHASLWLTVLFVFFSVIPSKRDLYLLPAYPAAALLGARWLAVSIRARRFPSAVGWFASGVLGLLALALALAGPASSLSDQVPAGLAWRGPLAALGVGAGTAWGAWHLRRRRFFAWARSLLVTWVLAVSFGLLLLVPVIDPLKSARSVAEFLAARPERPETIPCFGVHPEAYRFYGGVPTVKGDSWQAAFERDGDDFLALMKDLNWERIPAELRSELRVLLHASVGSRKLVVVGSAARGLNAEASSTDR